MGHSNASGSTSLSDRGHPPFLRLFCLPLRNEERGLNRLMPSLTFLNELISRDASEGRQWNSFKREKMDWELERIIMKYTSFILRDRTPKPFRPISSNSYLRETWQFLRNTTMFGLFAGPQNRTKTPKFEIFRTPWPPDISGWRVLCSIVKIIASLSTLH